MCVFDLEQGEVMHVFNLSGPKCAAILSPDGTRLRVVVQGAYREGWLLDIDPGKPLAEILAPTLTGEQHLARLLGQYDRIMASDASCADHCLSRALVFFARGDLDAAHQDVDRCRSLITDPNDPAVWKLRFWANRYFACQHDPEAKWLILGLPRLGEQFPTRFQNAPEPFKRPFQQLAEIYRARGDDSQALVWQERWSKTQDTSGN